MKFPVSLSGLVFVAALLGSLISSTRPGRGYAAQRVVRPDA